MPNQLAPILHMLSSTFSLSLTGLFSKFLSEHLDTSLFSLLRFSIAKHRVKSKQMRRHFFRCASLDTSPDPRVHRALRNLDTHY